MDRLKEEDFSDEYKPVWKAISDLRLQNKAIEPVGVGELSSHSVVASLESELVDESGFPEWVDALVRESSKRRLVSEANRLIYAQSDVYDDLQNLSQLLIDCQNRLSDGGVQKLSDGLEPAIDRLLAGDAGLETGFPSLDKMLQGLEPGRLVLLAGRPSMGKTSLALNMATNLAVRYGHVVAFLSLEMSTDELVYKAICSEANIDYQRFRYLQVTPDEWERVLVVLQDISDAPLYLDDNPSSDFADLQASIRRLYTAKRCRVVFIDYLQLLSFRGESRNQEISNITRALKKIAKDLGITVVLLSQLSRQSEHRSDHRPLLSDLRDSGAIEQDADQVVFLYREEYYLPDDAKAKGVAEVIVAKNRMGEVGSLEMAFCRGSTTFMESDD